MYSNHLKNGNSVGDDLLGFLIDLEYAIESIEGVTNLEACTSSDKENLLIASCNFSMKISERQMAKKFEEVWKEELRYREFEIHSSNISDGLVIFYFCTTSGSLGVTGKIVARHE